MNTDNNHNTQPTSFNDNDIPKEHWNSESVQKWCKVIGIPYSDIKLIRDNNIKGRWLFNPNPTSTELKYSPGIDDSVAESIAEQLVSNFINQFDLILQTLNDIELRPKYFPNWKDGQIFQLRNILESPGFTEFIDMTYNINPTYKSIIEEEEKIVLDLNMPYEGRDNEIEDIVEVYKNNNIPEIFSL
ncbi:hypothetical protein DLAC_10265 [Tieghemostelium lacteum]|uniref:Uncharacterized protein n=1 Tax=Tieghemostelium lacteum TaxID=361077 RepID=A0A151Z524_TIELA|nr:hypothetical protein DLAC_10265 [Tieghemostelium lacteum]|eukprot:KYQ89041.1 hypothetical protein DLAC_10265 [Tieghemostelium lacteum]